MLDSKHMIDILRCNTIPSVYALVDDQIAKVKVYRQNTVNIISENLFNKISKGKKVIKQKHQYFVTETDFFMDSNSMVELEIKFKNATIKDTFWIAYDIDDSYDILISFSVQRKYSLYVSYDDSLCMKLKDTKEHITISLPSDVYSIKEFLEWSKLKSITYNNENHDEIHESIQLSDSKETKLREIDDIKDIEIQNLKTLLSQLQADYNKLKETSNSNIEKLKKNYNKLYAQNQKGNITIYNLSKQNNQLKEDLNNLEECNYTLNNNLNLSNNEINVLLKKNKQMEEQNEKKSQVISSLNDKIDEYDKSNYKLFCQINELKSKMIHDEFSKIRQHDTNLQLPLKSDESKLINMENNIGYEFSNLMKIYYGSLKLIGNYKTTRHYFEILLKFKHFIFRNSYLFILIRFS
ncbi:hypothetical protein H8356DRAFT_1675972 [Neocallimastix lanati (nom. inval.)]|uniref:Uncharacterized protein n=1 Tax=Neocallimastix californiae TaxID=1754190 RepID=A0A1Y2BXH7_9FUNG|nr:hypothetical protein H8356DRAFT_1675972 [Neocallimastix sp. JGI-2020a]ORY39461.1 hypothetical protein LY90DRAFT_704304 [Neocallimastix californiae]|eukprot:ORY39461.1 hypothetical protein LY90DRAFT_704304 [Neocallimastix californiae]